jgi:hypothetical protein
MEPIGRSGNDSRQSKTGVDGQSGQKKKKGLRVESLSHDESILDLERPGGER